MNTIREIASDILTSALAGAGYSALRTLGERAIEKHKKEWKEPYRAFTGLGAAVTGAGLAAANFIRNITKQKSYLAGIGSALLSALAYGGAYWATNKLINISQALSPALPGAMGIIQNLGKEDWETLRDPDVQKTIAKALQDLLKQTKIGILEGRLKGLKGEGTKTETNKETNTGT